MNSFNNFILIIVITPLLYGCSSGVSHIHNNLDYETMSATNLSYANPVKGYKQGKLNLIKFKPDNANNTAYKLKVSAKGDKPAAFKAGESLLLVRNKHENITLTTDGEVTSYYENNRPVRDVYFDIDAETLDKIITAKKLKFIADGKAFSVAGKLGRTQIADLARLAKSKRF